MRKSCEKDDYDAEFGRNGRIKSHARGSGEKTGRKRSVLTKTVAKKVSRG